MKMRTCGESKCSKRVKPYGEPTLHGNFLDQIVVCGCGWSSVQTEILSDAEVLVKKTQIGTKLIVQKTI